MFPYELIYFATIFLIETHILHPFYPIAIFPITILVKFLRCFIKRTAKLIFTILFVLFFLLQLKGYEQTTNCINKIIEFKQL